MRLSSRAARRYRRDMIETPTALAAALDLSDEAGGAWYSLSEEIA